MNDNTEVKIYALPQVACSSTPSIWIYVLNLLVLLGLMLFIFPSILCFVFFMFSMVLNFVFFPCSLLLMALGFLGGLTCLLVPSVLPLPDRLLLWRLCFPLGTPLIPKNEKNTELGAYYLDLDLPMNILVYAPRWNCKSLIHSINVTSSKSFSLILGTITGNSETKS